MLLALNVIQRHNRCCTSNASQHLVLIGPLLDAIKARDALQIKSVYYPMMEKLLTKATGASRVHIFDHTLRKGTIKDAK